MDTKPIDVGKIAMVNPSDVAGVYTNNAETIIGPWDIRLVFSEILSDGTGSDLRKELRANISMNPAHAKALVVALETAVKEFERIYGSITMPTGIAAPANKAQ